LMPSGARGISRSGSWKRLSNVDHAKRAATRRRFTWSSWPRSERSRLTFRCIRTMSN